MKCLECGNKIFHLGCGRLAKRKWQKGREYGCFKCKTYMFIPIPKKNYFFIDRFGRQKFMTKVINDKGKLRFEKTKIGKVKYKAYGTIWYKKDMKKGIISILF